MNRGYRLGVLLGAIVLATTWTAALAQAQLPPAPAIFW